MDRFEDIQVSQKNVKQRAILTAVFIVLAAVCFGYGIYQMGKKEEGIYVVETEYQDDLRFYDDGIQLHYYFGGSSSEIKEDYSQLSDLFSLSLQNVYCLLDHQNEYEEYFNIASLNHHLNEEVILDDTLYSIITDAYEKTTEGNGYNLFAGPINEFWDKILYSDYALESDPAFNEYERQRLETIRDLVNDPECCYIEIRNENTHKIIVHVDEEVIRKMNELEFEYGILDLGLLHDAYMCDLLSEELNRYGYTDGYLYFASGLVCSLSDRDFGSYHFYANTGSPKEIGEISLSDHLTLSCFKSFAVTDEDGYFSFDNQGRVNRHPYISGIDAYPFVQYSSSYVFGHRMNAVETVYGNIVLQDGTDIDPLSYVYNQNGEGVIHTNSKEIQFVEDIRISEP